MKRPVESDYTSHVAYTRALEEYCDWLVQPVQEPVATVIKKGADRQWMSERLASLPDGIYSLYTTPPAQPAPVQPMAHIVGEIDHTGKVWKPVQPAPVQPVGDEWTPCMKLPVVVHVRKQRHGESHKSTREGITPVKPDDLIMRGVSGEEYPIGRAIFEQTYTLDTTPPAQPAVQQQKLERK
jgi:hypothetical protein